MSVFTWAGLLAILGIRKFELTYPGHSRPLVIESSFFLFSASKQAEHN